jgi:hypothetical protein
MEVPVWILAVSNLLVSLFLIALIILLIVLIASIKALIGKFNRILDEAEEKIDEAINLAKKSAITRTVLKLASHWLHKRDGGSSKGDGKKSGKKAKKTSKRSKKETIDLSDF